MNSGNKTKVEIFLRSIDLSVTGEIEITATMLSERSMPIIPLLSLPFTYLNRQAKVVHYSCIDNEIVVIHNCCKNGKSAFHLTFEEFFKNVTFD